MHAHLPAHPRSLMACRTVCGGSLLLKGERLFLLLPQLMGRMRALEVQAIVHCNLKMSNIFVSAPAPSEPGTRARQWAWEGWKCWCRGG